MIRVDHPQGSREWLCARAGVVTASEAKSILTPATRKPAKAEAYFHRIVAERLLGEPVATEGNPWTERGHDLEDAALRWLAFDRDLDIERVGLLLNDARTLGASPDGLTASVGVEVKCPSAVVHVRNLIDPEAFKVDHYGQCQVGMIVSERPAWQLMSFNPTLPKVVVLVERDEGYVSAYLEAHAAFLARVEEAVSRIERNDPTRFLTMPDGEVIPNPFARRRRST